MQGAINIKTPTNKHPTDQVQITMRTDILSYLQNEIYERCQKPTNHFGMGCYYHIEAVVKNSGLLADKFGADKEIVMIAAWLHDVASITDYSLYENHHIHGAEIAYELLTNQSYDEAKIQLVQNVYINKQNIEEICVADADAISHLDNIQGLLYLVYAEKHLSMEEGKQYVINKLKRSFSKLSEESKAFYTEKYQQAMSVLGA